MEQEQNINIAALLKDCPKGTKLYSPLCGECYYNGESDNVSKPNISCKALDGSKFILNVYGQGYTYQEHGECLAFPSKEVRDWGCFRVKYAWGGDDAKGLLEKEGGVHAQAHNFFHKATVFYIDAITKEIKALGEYDDRATFDYILSTGTELKLEEKEEPEFKVGDVVRADSDIYGNNVIGVVKATEHCGYKNDRFTLWIVDGGKDGTIDMPITDFDRLATPEEIAKWNNEVLEPHHLHYSKSKRKIEHWFLPFDKVVVRFEEDKSVNWIASFYSHFNGKDFVCVDGTPYAQCLPYDERTAKLIGTTDDYKEDGESKGEKG